MTLFLGAVLAVYLLSIPGWGPPTFLMPASLAAAFLLPGNGLLSLVRCPRTPFRVFVMGTALSPVVCGSVWIAALLLDLPARPVLQGAVALLGLLAVLLDLRSRERPTDSTEDPGAAAWWIGLGFLAVVAVVLVPSEWRRVASDAWFHTAVVFEMERSGIPPEDPYFAGLPLQYFWFFHAVLLSLRVLSGIDPPWAMAFLNLVGVLLVVPAASRLVRGLGYSTASGVWAGAMFLLGMGGMALLFFPLKLVTAFMGDVRGAEEMKSLVNLTPLTPDVTELFVDILRSSSFLLKKFLVGTALSWTFILLFVAADAALRLVRTGERHQHAVLFIASMGAFLFHIIVGGALLAALAGSAALMFVLNQGPRVRLASIAALVAASMVVTLPYLQSATQGKEASNVFPLGVSLMAWLSLPPTMLGVALLAFPLVKRLFRRIDPWGKLYVYWLGFALLYCLFARLPGPNQFDKPPIVLHLPLALLAGAAVPLLWSDLKNRPKLRAAFAVSLVLFLVPVNVIRWCGFFADRHAPPLSAEETSLYSWMQEGTPRDAIVIDADERVEVLFRVPRRQYWGIEGYADMWGYPVEEMARRKALRDALYSGEGLTSDLLEPLQGLDGPVYVVARDPSTNERLAKPWAPGGPDTWGLFEAVFSQDDIGLYRLKKMHFRNDVIDSSTEEPQ